MDKIIQAGIEQYPLSGSDIATLTKGKTNILRYSQLEDKSLDEILGQYGACIILLEYPNQTIGHWVLLFRHKNGDIEYYNSFAYPIDYVGQGIKLKPIIQQKLIGKRVIVNKECLQKKKEDINTCGRYCVLRLFFRDTSLQNFNKLLTQNSAYYPDFWVSCFTTQFIDF